MSLFSQVAPSIAETLKGVVEEKASTEVSQEKGVMSTNTPPKEEESFAVKYAMEIVGREPRVLEPVPNKSKTYKVELPEVDDLEVEAYLKRVEIEEGPITPPTTMGEMAGATASDVATERDEAGITQSRTEPASVYKIKKGDNLSKIARANNTTVDAILELNDIANPDIIVEGERLVMPDLVSPTANLETASVMSRPEPTANLETAGVMSRPEPVEVPAFKSYNSPEEMSDLEILARTIEAEASGEPYKGKVAVGATIANRVASGSYGAKGGIKGVILKEGQFSPWNSYTGYAEGKQGKDMLNLKASEDSYKAAKAILTGNYTDPTNGATHYVRESIAEGQSWIDKMKAREKGTVTIGNHLFGNADNNKVYDGRLAIMERSSETTDQPVVAQPPTVQLVQRIVGATADGAFGPNTRKKAEAYLSDAGVDIPKDATDEQIMDLVVNKPVYDQETVKKVKEAPTTAAALEITADAAAKKDPLLIKNPIQWIYEQPNLIGLTETNAEGQKTIIGFFDNSLGEGQKFYVRPEDARAGINHSITTRPGAWCATFVDHVLTNLGVDRLQKTIDGKVTDDAKVGAIHYQTLGDGVDISETKAGDLAVLAGHVGFVVGKVEGVATSNVANARALQEGLTKAGFSTKGVDGMWGPNSAAALTAYQKANNLPVTGNVTPELYKSLTNKEGTTTNNVLVLGGNQDNSVNVTSFPATKIKHFRRVGPIQDLDKKTFDAVTEDIKKAGSVS